MKVVGMGGTFLVAYGNSIPEILEKMRRRIADEASCYAPLFPRSPLVVSEVKTRRVVKLYEPRLKLVRSVQVDSTYVYDEYDVEFEELPVGEDEYVDPGWFKLLGVYKRIPKPKGVKGLVLRLLRRDKPKYVAMIWLHA